jgi:hypothetical protein
MTQIDVCAYRWLIREPSVLSSTTMSDTPSIPASRSVVLREVLQRIVTELRAGARRALALLRSVAFWVAVTLPVLYPVALLHATGSLPALLAVDPVPAGGVLPALLATHAVAVALGHGHQPG